MKYLSSLSGGWVIATIDTYDASPRALANQAKAIVVSVEYRKAPENKFPTSHDDAVAAYKYVVENAGKWNGDTKRVRRHSKLAERRRRWLVFLVGGSTMAPRAIWKGAIRLAEVTCPVSMYTAASTSERIAFHTLNRKTGHRVHREYVDDETGKPVEAADQVKGYETGNGQYVVLEPEELASAIPDTDKLLAIDTFIACAAVDDTYFDRPYYLLPASPVAEESFALLREGMRDRKVAAIAHSVLFRRLRAVLIRPHRKGLIATTLNFDYEVRSADDAFSDIPARKIEGEMLDLAEHIISTKAGAFDPKTFDDRYDAALAELVKAKMEGKALKAPPKPTPTKPHDLLEALRMSAGTTISPKHKPSKKAAAVPNRKAG